MINSMTGFGSKEVMQEPFGKISVELRSVNHKFLEIVLHLPDGFLALEDRIKKEIETKIKRGRIICAVNITGARTHKAFVNRSLLRDYIGELGKIKREFKLQSTPSLDTLINLPGVLTLDEQKLSRNDVFLRLRQVLSGALSELVKMRQKEGRALYGFLKSRAEFLAKDLAVVKARYKKALKTKCASFKTDEERSSFLRNSDINEELERLGFHVRNFKTKLPKSLAIGKELDFIAQEMQREANTMAAKVFDASVSARVVQMKSQIEKIREQVQNVE